MGEELWLRFCPFCGAKAAGDNDGDGAFWVHCPKCGSRSGKQATEVAAEVAWNVRSSGPIKVSLSPPQRAILEYVRDHNRLPELDPSENKRLGVTLGWARRRRMIAQVGRDGHCYRLTEHGVQALATGQAWRT